MPGREQSHRPTEPRGRQVDRWMAALSFLTPYCLHRDPGSSKGDDIPQTDAPTPAATPPTELNVPQSSLDQSALAEIRELAERAIAQDPLNARAFRILGQISERTSDEMQTQKLMQAAVRRSLLRSVADYWMMRKSFQDQNYSAALRYADTLVRTRPQALAHIMSLMGKMAELPEASDDLKMLLSTTRRGARNFSATFRSASDFGVST
jgi:hypothetical protein